MLEVALTRLILHSAQRYIRDIRTDSVSLWSGELILQNLELKTDELEEVLQLPDWLCIERGFVRELRICVPWIQIRSSCMEVHVDAVELIVRDMSSSSRGPNGDQSMSKEKCKASFDSSAAKSSMNQGSWIQPMLQSVVCNTVVWVNNLLIRLLSDKFSACLAVGQLKTLPAAAPPLWEEGFQSLPRDSPVVYRKCDFSEISLSVHVEEQEKGSGVVNSNEKRSKAWMDELVLHRASLQAFAVVPLGASNKDPLKVDVQVGKEWRLAFSVMQLNALLGWLFVRSPPVSRPDSPSQQALVLRNARRGGGSTERPSLDSTSKEDAQSWSSWVSGLVAATLLEDSESDEEEDDKGEEGMGDASWTSVDSVRPLLTFGMVALTFELSSHYSPQPIRKAVLSLYGVAAALENSASLFEIGSFRLMSQDGGAPLSAGVDPLHPRVGLHSKFALSSSVPQLRSLPLSPAAFRWSVGVDGEERGKLGEVSGEVPIGLVELLSELAGAVNIGSTREGEDTEEASRPRRHLIVEKLSVTVEIAPGRFFLVSIGESSFGTGGMSHVNPTLGRLAPVSDVMGSVLRSVRQSICVPEHVSELAGVNSSSFSYMHLWGDPCITLKYRSAGRTRAVLHCANLSAIQLTQGSTHDFQEVYVGAFLTYLWDEVLQLLSCELPAEGGAVCLRLSRIHLLRQKSEGLIFGQRREEAGQDWVLLEGKEPEGSVEDVCGWISEASILHASGGIDGTWRSVLEPQEWTYATQLARKYEGRMPRKPGNLIARCLHRSVAFKNFECSFPSLDLSISSLFSPPSIRLPVGESQKRRFESFLGLLAARSSCLVVFLAPMKVTLSSEFCSWGPLCALVLGGCREHNERKQKGEKRMKSRKKGEPSEGLGKRILDVEVYPLKLKLETSGVEVVCPYMTARPTAFKILDAELLCTRCGLSADADCGENPEVLIVGSAPEFSGDWISNSSGSLSRIHGQQPVRLQLNRRTLNCLLKALGDVVDFVRVAVPSCESVKEEAPSRRFLFRLVAPFHFSFEGASRATLSWKGCVDLCHSPRSSCIRLSKPRLFHEKPEGTRQPLLDFCQEAVVLGEDLEDNPVENTRERKNMGNADSPLKLDALEWASVRKTGSKVEVAAAPLHLTLPAKDILEILMDIFSALPGPEPPQNTDRDEWTELQLRVEGLRFQLSLPSSSDQKAATVLHVSLAEVYQRQGEPGITLDFLGSVGVTNSEASPIPILDSFKVKAKFEKFWDFDVDPLRIRFDAASLQTVLCLYDVIQKTLSCCPPPLVSPDVQDTNGSPLVFRCRGLQVLLEGLSSERKTQVRVKAKAISGEDGKLEIQGISLEADEGRTICALRSPAVKFSSQLAAIQDFECRVRPSEIAQFIKEVSHLVESCQVDSAHYSSSLVEEPAAEPQGYTVSFNRVDASLEAESAGLKLTAHALDIRATFLSHLIQKFCLRFAELCTNVSRTSDVFASEVIDGMLVSLSCHCLEGWALRFQKEGYPNEEPVPLPLLCPSSVNVEVALNGPLGSKGVHDILSSRVLVKTSALVWSIGHESWVSLLNLMEGIRLTGVEMMGLIRELRRLGGLSKLEEAEEEAASGIAVFLEAPRLTINWMHFCQEKWPEKARFFPVFDLCCHPLRLLYMSGEDTVRAKFGGLRAGFLTSASSERESLVAGRLLKREPGGEDFFCVSFGDGRKVQLDLSEKYQVFLNPSSLSKLWDVYDEISSSTLSSIIFGGTGGSVSNLPVLPREKQPLSVSNGLPLPVFFRAGPCGGCQYVPLHSDSVVSLPLFPSLRFRVLGDERELSLKRDREDDGPSMRLEFFDFESSKREKEIGSLNLGKTFRIFFLVLSEMEGSKETIKVFLLPNLLVSMEMEMDTADLYFSEVVQTALTRMQKVNPHMKTWKKLKCAFCSKGCKEVEVSPGSKINLKSQKLSFCSFDFGRRVAVCWVAPSLCSSPSPLLLQVSPLLLLKNSTELELAVEFVGLGSIPLAAFSSRPVTSGTQSDCLIVGPTFDRCVVQGIRIFSGGGEASSVVPLAGLRVLPSAEGGGEELCLVKIVKVGEEVLLAIKATWAHASCHLQKLELLPGLTLENRSESCFFLVGPDGAAIRDKCFPPETSTPLSACLPIGGVGSQEFRCVLALDDKSGDQGEISLTMKNPVAHVKFTQRTLVAFLRPSIALSSGQTAGVTVQISPSVTVFNFCTFPVFLRENTSSSFCHVDSAGSPGGHPSRLALLTEDIAALWGAGAFVRPARRLLIGSPVERGWELCLGEQLELSLGMDEDSAKEQNALSSLSFSFNDLKAESEHLRVAASLCGVSQENAVRGGLLGASVKNAEGSYIGVDVFLIQCKAGRLSFALVPAQCPSVCLANSSLFPIEILVEGFESTPLPLPSFTLSTFSLLGQQFLPPEVRLQCGDESPISGASMFRVRRAEEGYLPCSRPINFRIEGLYQLDGLKMRLEIVGGTPLLHFQEPGEKGSDSTTLTGFNLQIDASDLKVSLVDSNSDFALDLRSHGLSYIHSNSYTISKGYVSKLASVQHVLNFTSFSVSSRFVGAENIARISSMMLCLAQEPSGQLSIEVDKCGGRGEASLSDEGLTQLLKAPVFFQNREDLSLEGIYAAATSAFVLKSLKVPPLPLTLSLKLRSYLPLPLSVGHASVTMEEISVKSPSKLPLRRLLSEIGSHYLASVLFQLPSLLGALDILGNPAGFLRHTSKGVKDLVSIPGGEGVLSFFKEVRDASWGSISAFSSSVLDTLPRGEGRLRGRSHVSSPVVASPRDEDEEENSQGEQDGKGKWHVFDSAVSAFCQQYFTRPQKDFSNDFSMNLLWATDQAFSLTPAEINTKQEACGSKLELGRSRLWLVLSSTHLMVFPGALSFPLESLRLITGPIGEAGRYLASLDCGDGHVLQCSLEVDKGNQLEDHVCRLQSNKF